MSELFPRESDKPKLTANTQELSQLLPKAVEDKINKEVTHAKNSLYTVFGVFASLFTFISIEVQILKDTCDIYKIMGLSLITLSLLLFFIVVLDHIGKGWKETFRQQLNHFPWHLLFIVGLLFLTGIWSASSGNELLCMENYIFQRYEKNFIKKQILLDQSIQKDIQQIQQKINKNTNEITKLQSSQSFGK